MRGDLPAARGTGTVHPSGHMMNRIRKFVLARDRYTCHLCGCPGADGIDHLVPAAECEARGISLMNADNMRAAHSRRACPSCSAEAGRPVYCNSLRGNLSVPAARLKLSKILGRPVMGTDATARTGKPATGEREW